MTEEYKKCLKDPIYFIENYCLINNKSIKLKDYQKSFIKYVVMNKYNLVILEAKQCIPFLNLTEQEFYDKLWEWTYEDDLWDYIEENDLPEEELDNWLSQFIDENIFHTYEDDDVNCFAFINTDEGIVEYQTSEKLFDFVYNKIKEHYGS